MALLTQTEAELVRLRDGVRRGRPFGEPSSALATAKRLGVEARLRPRGRPHAARAAAKSVPDEPGGLF